MVYALFRWTPDDEGTAQYLMASDSHRLLSFVVGSLLSYESATAFALFPKRVPKRHFRPQRLTDLEMQGKWPDEKANHPDESRRDVNGYRLYLNFRHYAQVLENQKLYPPHPEIIQFPMDLGQMIDALLGQPENWALKKFVQNNPRINKRDSTEQRIMRAIGWYNQSCSAVVDQDENRMVSLATAFEALFDHDFSDMVKEGDPDNFNKEPGPITPKFFLTLHTLLGHIDRLDLWAAQFYDARSKIVHTGRAAALRFSPQRSSKKNKQQGNAKPSDEMLQMGGLDDIGKHVFQLCLATMLAGHEHARSANVGAKLIHNQERLQQICGMLDGNEKDDAKYQMVALVVRQLQKDNVSISDTTRMVPHDLLLNAASRFLGLLLRLPIEWNETERQTIGAAAKSNTSDEYGDVMERFNAAQDILTDGAMSRLEFVAPANEMLHVLSNFVDYVSLNLLVGVLIPAAQKRS